MTTSLFQPITLGGLSFPNRIAVAPMCQYSAEDGSASDWHLHHWMNLAMSGAGMVTVEMTDVERRGRITHGCLGLYSDDNEAAARRTLDAARRVAPPGTKFGTQLAHAGRKASNRRPWEGGGPLRPTRIPGRSSPPRPSPTTPAGRCRMRWRTEEILQLIERFAEAARRAERAGFDFIELHAAHGYLIFQFLSPLSNQRTDRWGGSLENRMRFVVEITKAVRKAVPGLMLGARLSVKEWVDGGFDVDDAIEVAKALKAEGVAYLCCSSGGNSPLQKLPSGPGYQVHLAEAVRKGADIPTRAVGLIDDPQQAEMIIADGRADMVALARAFLADPRWGWRAAATFGEEIHPAPQLARSVTTMRHWMKAAG